MYPWHSILTHWAAKTGLHVDALGLVTILGSDEVNNSVGRLVSGSYVEYLPLLGAFVLAGDRFTEKRPGFMLYNFTSSMQTTELAGWFSRWLKAQEFSQIRDIVTWKVKKCPPRRSWQAFLIRFFLIGMPLNGMLIALTVLSKDWWGFSNAVSMVFSILVRVFLVSQRRAGIDETIRDAQKEAVDDYLQENYVYARNQKLGALRRGKQAPIHPDKNIAKVIVVMDDSKVVTIKAPEYLIGKVFAKNPPIPNPRLYQLFQSLGWMGFGSHLITLGMAGLHTQIYTTALLILATILFVYKAGCDDWRFRQRSRSTNPPDCWISNSLAASCSQYEDEYADWSTLSDSPGQSSNTYRSVTDVDEEKASPSINGAKKVIRTERRQDLYAWLLLSDHDLQLMEDWYLVPHRNKKWMKDFTAKRTEHNKRSRHLKTCTLES